jgi:hypothetical protein
MATSKELHQKVRAGFIVQGTSLNAWCQKNSITRQYADLVLLKKRDGDKARELRRRIVEAANIAIAA